MSDTDSDRDRSCDSAFSHGGQFNAFAIGMAVGVVVAMPVPRLSRFVFGALALDADKRSDAMREARAESAYGFAGMVCGLVLGTVLWLAWFLLAARTAEVALVT